MMKKFGLVATGVTAGLLAFAPLAAADGDHHDGGGQDCSVTAEEGQPAEGPVNECNENVNQNNGEGNTFNGIELPGFPSLP